jgi:hypothetical protein
MQVTLRPGTKEARSFPAELLRAVEGRGLALLSLPRPVEAPEPPPLGTAKGFVETAPVELLGLREPWRGGAFDVDSAFAQLRHGMVASLEHDHGQKLTALNVDLGVGTGFQAGAAINASGEVVGLAGATPTAEEGSHVLPVIPAERIEQFLGGDVRGVAARYVADGLGHCYVELNAELDDPLHAVEQVGVAVAELAGLDALALGAAEPPAQTVQRAVEGGSSRVLLDIRPERCPPVLGFQLFLERNRGGRARDVWRALPLQPSPVEVKSQTYESSFLVGDQAPLNFKEFLATRMVPPKGWTPVCEPSEPDSCARACAGGEFRGCYVQALQLYPRATSGFAYAQFPPLKRACDADVGPACHVMGLGYEKASPRERPQASRYFDIACAHGVGAACRKIALERQAAGNHDGAIRALRRGCEYLDGESCDRLGETYLRGEGVEKDVQTAAEHFLRACQTFQATGCVNLAKVYGEGTLGAPDPAVAFRLYSNACELGLADACLTVGRLSTEGRGTDRALNHAEAAYRKACGLGNREACETMRMLRR